MLVLFLNIFLTISFAQSKPSLLEKVATDFMQGELDTCKTHYPDCEKLFELTLLEEPTTLPLMLKSSAVFLRVHDLTKMCSNVNQDACQIISASFNDAKDDCQKFSKESNLLCSDMRSFRLNTCQKIQDSFLGSVCSKKILPACQKDLTCLIAWSFVFREDAERFRLTPPEIQKAFMSHFILEKNSVTDNLKTLPPSVVNSSDVIPATNFLAPGKIIDFSLPSVVSTKNPKPKKDVPEFKPLTVIESAFSPGVRDWLQPWRRGEILTVADWNGDGYLDVFSLDGGSVVLFENINGTKFKKFSLDLSSFGVKPTLVDISIADLDGDGIPAILVQALPRSLYVLRWQKEKKSFSVEQVTLPNFSRMHAYVKLKNEIGIIFPGWSGISSSTDNMANDYLAKIKDKKWVFEKISTSKAPTLGVSVVEKGNGQSIVVIHKDLEGGTDLYSVGDEGLTKLPTVEKINYYSMSSAYLKTAKDEELWMSAGMSFLGEKGSKPVPSFKSIFKSVEDCGKGLSKSEQELCVMRLNLPLTTNWPSLCLESKNPDYVRLCLMQNENPGIKGIKMRDPAHFTAQIFKNIEAPIIDEAGSKVVSQLGQIMHVSSIQSPGIEGFVASEVPRNGAPRRLWWISTSGGEIQKVELTDSLGLKKPYEATHFALADFDKDGQLDMVFRNGLDLVFLKGDTSGNSSLKGNLQSGHQSRTLINIFKNSKTTP